MKPIFEFAATVKFEDVKNQYKSLENHFGPRKKHKHGLCDCGSYMDKNHPMKREWSYREDIAGYESIIAFSDEQARELDDLARASEQILHDE